MQIHEPILILHVLCSYKQLGFYIKGRCSHRQGNLSLYMQIVGNGSEDYGWVLINEIPKAALLLSACVGSGLQILCTMFVILLLACVGILAPPNRGALVIALLVSHL